MPYAVASPAATTTRPESMQALSQPLPRHTPDTMLATLFDAVPEAMLVVDSGGTIRMANLRAEELFRYAPEALCRVVQGMRERVRGGDTLARLGGDEFAIVAPYASPSAARVIARDMLGVVRAVGRGVDGSEPAVTASVGVAALGLPGQDAVGALAEADRAMYRAKRAGGDTIRVARRAGDGGGRG